MVLVKAYQNFNLNYEKKCYGSQINMARRKNET